MSNEQDRSSEVPRARTVLNIEEVALSPGLAESNQNLAAAARGSGLIDMRDVVDQLLNSSKYMKMQEVKDETGKVVAYQPQFKFEVDWGNAEDVSRFLLAGMVICLAAVDNEAIRVPWAQGRQASEVFGASFENGSYVFRRQPGANYLNIMKAYADAFQQTQAWCRQQLASLEELAKVLEKGSENNPQGSTSD